MQKILKWLSPVVAAGVAIFLLLFLFSINSVEEVSENDTPLKIEKRVQESPETVWINHFSDTQRKGYFYPVNEVYVKIDLNEKILNSNIYKLSASLLDPYQVFCLKEELKLHNFKYFFKNDKDGVELLIYSKNIEKLNSLVKVLKNYQIKARIELYKEEV